MEDKPSPLVKPSRVEDKPSVEVKPSHVEDKTSAEVKPSRVEDKTSAEAKPSHVEDSLPADVPENFPLKEAFKPLPEVDAKAIEKLPSKKPPKQPEDKFPLQEAFKPLPEVKPEPPAKAVEPPRKRTELFPLQEVFRPLSALQLEKLDKMTPEATPPPQDNIDAEDTLDDILDKAYNERSLGHMWQAIELYKRALERYRNDDYAPFVAIDLGNIFKEQALYSNAIKNYEAALKLPAVKHNEDIRKEFIDNLEYLRVVRNVLLSHRALSTPFDELPKEILQEIDTEFKKQRATNNY